jgi:dolichyl-phosphate beta-glucosyltransferase
MNKSAPSNSFDISIIIPAWNESDKIVSDLQLAVNFLTQSGISGQVIVVDDGSTDSTVAKSRDFASQNSNSRVSIEIITPGSHIGKGSSVKTGILHSTGRLVLFIDSGSCVPYNFVAHGIDLVKTGKCHIAHGSRKLSQSHIIRKQTLARRLSSLLFRLVARIYLGLPRTITDSQAGLKIYDGPAARELYKDLVTPGFMFDLEIILRALKKGLKIQEFPIEWTCDLDTRLRPGRTFLQVIKELASIKKILR